MIQFRELKNIFNIDGFSISIFFYDSIVYFEEFVISFLFKELKLYLIYEKFTVYNI